MPEPTDEYKLPKTVQVKGYQYKPLLENMMSRRVSIVKMKVDFMSKVKDQYIISYSKRTYWNSDFQLTPKCSFFNHDSLKDKAYDAHLALSSTAEHDGSEVSEEIAWEIVLGGWSASKVSLKNLAHSI